VIDEDGRPQCIEAIVDRQQRKPAERDDDRLLLDRKDGRPSFPESSREIGDSLTPLALSNSLLVDPMALQPAPSLWRSRIKKLPHCVSFESHDKNAR
jgi:hypothetical protein